jgi:2-keto-4-pentenoate hydratase
MTEQADAAAILWQNWQQRTRIDQLPPDCRPGDRAAGYSAQKDIVTFSGQDVVGWKIAATSAAGQKHIGVDGPLAGPLLANRVLADGATVPLDGNIMMVVEAEFAFKFAGALPRRADPYAQEEVLDAVESLHPAIEVPDSRYNDFVKVGAPQLIADTACADWFVLGRPTTADWRSRDLVAHAVGAYRNGEKVAPTCSAIPAWRSRGSSTNCARTPTVSPPASSSRPARASCRCRFSVATHFARTSESSGPWT